MMPPKGRKRSRRTSSDILINLPNNIIDAILTCLPYKDVVRTSILSKKWRYVWCKLRELTFDSSLWVTEEELQNPTDKFTKIMDHLFTHHKGRITKFTLDLIHLSTGPNIDDIDSFIYFLSKKRIQHLVLDLPCSNREELPYSFFKCSLLKHLSLNSCVIFPPPAFRGFNKLISMELWGVFIFGDSLESLISHCPLLEELVLYLFKNFDVIEISAPKLRVFEFHGGIKFVRLKNVPLLEKLSLTESGFYTNPENIDLAKLFKPCSALEHLHFDVQMLEFFEKAVDEAPMRLPFDLNSVKRLYLPNVRLTESYSFSCALCLIRSFPRLEYLEIKVDGCDGYDSDRYTGDDYDSPLTCLKMENFSHVTFDHLKEVKLARFTGKTREMQLVEILLAKSPVLVRMLIKPLGTGMEALTEVSKFWRASPEAVLVLI